MAKRMKDTEWLAISARIRAMEGQLLGRERMDQILDARTDEDALKLLQELGYPELDPRRPEEMDAAIARARRESMEDLADGVPDRRYIELFELRYDYHNAKAVLKAGEVGADPAPMLMDQGRVPPAELSAAIRESAWDDLSGRLGEAIAEAREVLETTRDPQLAEICLDRWYWRDLSDLAAATGSPFLEGYVAVQIDAAGLRALVRSLRMGKGAEFLRGVLAEGGQVDPDEILRVSANGGAGLTELYAPTGLAEAAESGAEVLKGGPMTEFERRCDDAVGAYLDRAKLVPFGEAPLVGYLAAKETEYLDLRILLLGRAAGLPADTIRARLRAAYV